MGVINCVIHPNDHQLLRAFISEKNRSHTNSHIMKIKNWPLPINFKAQNKKKPIRILIVCVSVATSVYMKFSAANIIIPNVNNLHCILLLFTE